MAEQSAPCPRRNRDGRTRENSQHRLQDGVEQVLLVHESAASIEDDGVLLVRIFEVLDCSHEFRTTLIWWHDPEECT